MTGSATVTWVSFSDAGEGCLCWYYSWTLCRSARADTGHDELDRRTGCVRHHLLHCCLNARDSASCRLENRCKYFTEINAEDVDPMLAHF